MRTLLPLLAISLPLTVALACADGGSPPSRGSGALSDLADRYWAWSLEVDPVSATYLGYEEHDGRLSDESAAARADRRARRAAFLEELRGIEPAELSGQDRLTRRALEEELETALADEVCAYWSWDVDHRDGPQISFLNLPQVQRAETPEAGRRMVRRWRAMGPWIDQHVENLREGLAEGRTPARIVVEHVVAQLEETLANPDESWPLLDPLKSERPEWTEAQRSSFRRDLVAGVRDGVRPAFARYREFLREELLPVARRGDRVGAHALPRGEACYAAAIRRFTSLELPAREIHEYGVRENERIRREMAELGTRLLGTSDVTEIQRRLREDPAMHFETGEQVFEKAVEATERAREAIPAWFGRLPEAEIVVKEIPDYEAPYTTIAYYRQPAADGSRPGTYFINTYAPSTRPRYEAETLAFHEGIPGHHLQIAIAQELEGIPEFRKHRGTTAFVEGWALYAERLSDEMGLYSGDLDRMGVLSFDAWRASRLVVDTGIHAFGWTRERAIDYMLANTLLARNNIENEVDRYISWPGQALAYKLGQREFLALRQKAREGLGEAFQIADFHDVVLGNGAVSLSVLRGVVEDWVEGAETR